MEKDNIMAILWQIYIITSDKKIIQKPYIEPIHFFKVLTPVLIH